MKFRKTNKVRKFEVKKAKNKGPEQWAKMSFVSRSVHAPLKRFLSVTGCSCSNWRNAFAPNQHRSSGQPRRKFRNFSCRAHLWNSFHVPDLHLAEPTTEEKGWKRRQTMGQTRRHVQGGGRRGRWRRRGDQSLGRRSSSRLHRENSSAHI